MENNICTMSDIRAFMNILERSDYKIMYLHWVRTYNKILLKQRLRNCKKLRKIQLYNPKMLGLIVVNSYTNNHINNFVIYNNNRLVKAPSPPKLQYIVDLNKHKCTCLSFHFQNYHIKGSCKHLEKCKKINDVIITCELINKTHLYGVPIPIKDMVNHILEKN